MKRYRLVALVVFVGLVSACGFHLRGSTNLPDELTQLRLIDDGLESNQLAQLSDMLVQAGANLQHSDASNPVELRVAISSLPERNLADGAGTGKTIVRLSKQLRYSLRKVGETIPLKNNVIQREVDLEQDSNNLLGTGSEKESAEEALEQTLFSQLIFQLKRL